MSDWKTCLVVMPDAGKAVFVFVPKAGKGGRILRAEWVSPNTILRDLDDDFDEDSDYVPSGWYEFPWYSDEQGRITDEVTHWMPLPPKPSGVWG